ncbi:MAG: ATP-binding cassette domain-containing protein [Streptosporangiales bacterium]|nr:ATP-binding cassette domain-containing protein [Streptosporangiales bacterium]
MMPGGQPGWTGMRSMSRDRSVTKEKISKETIRRIGAFARPYWRQVTVLVLILGVSAALGAANPLLFREIINKGILGKDIPLIVVLALVVAGIAVLTSGAMVVQRWIAARIGEGLIYDMRAQVFAHIQRMPIAFFTRTQTGALISRLNNDVLGAQRAFTTTLANVVSNLISVTVTLVAMFFLSWQITLTALLLLPLFLLPARYFGRKLQAITRESYDLNAEMNTLMTERLNVAGAMLVKLFGQHDREDNAFQGRAGRVRDIGVTQAVYGSFFMAALTLIAALATALVYGWGGIEAVRGLLDVGTVVAMTAYLTRLYGPLTALSNVNVDVMTALVSFDRVFEVLDLEPAVDDRPAARSLTREEATTIEFDHVDFRYPTADEISLASLESVATLDQRPEKQVLFDVSFRAEAGHLVALVGPSGAGKTTISHLVPRMYDVQDGAVRVGGQDVRDVRLADLRDVVGVVTQDSHMFHDTVRANLEYARADATDDEIWHALDDAHIGDLVRGLPDGLDTVVGERGYRLSGGEKQRLAIARLLLKAPSVVVLDEATAHLDSESEVAVQRALNTALAGRTSLVIAHRLSTVRHADLILVLDDGRVVERGRHDQLLAAGGLYADLYHTQFASQADDSIPV